MRAILAKPRTPPLTQAQAETLAIVAYLQPVSRPEVARIRGVSSESAVQTLSEREAGVVRLRFGLTDGQPRTLDEIGQVYGVTRERIRQIESKTMSKLRHPSRSQVMRDYLD